MSQMAETHADSPEVKKLASDIEAAQGPEIDTMTQWLQDWGKGVPSSSGSDIGSMDMGDGSHMDTGDMPGMMSDDDVHELDQAARRRLGPDVPHHDDPPPRGRRRDGQDPSEARAARPQGRWHWPGRSRRAQTAEIATMKDMLAS